MFKTNLGSLWFEAKGRCASFFCLWTTASAAKKEGFSPSHRDGWWKMDSLQQPKEKKVMGTARLFFYVVVSAEYSRCGGYAVYFVGPDRCYLLWAIETEWNHHWGTVSNASDAFESNTARKTATIRAEAQKVIVQHDNARPHVAKLVTEESFYDSGNEEEKKRQLNRHNKSNLADWGTSLMME